MAETEARSTGSDPSKPIVDDQQEALGNSIQGQSEPSEAPLTEVAIAQAPYASTTVDGGTESSTERQASSSYVSIDGTECISPALRRFYLTVRTLVTLRA
eukprot:6208333-Pleurochrysis_carterae.AAC.1